jgi:hypothetical protein
MESLVFAFLQWKYQAIPHQSTSSSLDFTIPVLDVYSMQTAAMISRDIDSKSAAEAIVLNGYLGTTPENPQLAVSLRTLELYLRIRIRKPSFSLEAFAKVACDLYGVGSFVCIASIMSHCRVDSLSSALSTCIIGRVSCLSYHSALGGSACSTSTGSGYA